MFNYVLILGLTLASSLFAAPVQVLQQWPTGEMDSQRSAFEIAVTFNQSMVALQGNQEMGEACPIKVSPSLPGRCRWRGTQTLVYEVSGGLKSATEYRVSVAAGFASQVSGEKLAKAHTWTFITPRPRLLSSAPSHDERWVDLQAKPLLNFTQPMDAGKAAGFIVLEEAPVDEPDPDPQPEESITQGGRERQKRQAQAGPVDGRSIRFTLMHLNQEGLKRLVADKTIPARHSHYTGEGRHFVLLPQRPLKPAKRYRIWLLKGLPGAEGGAGTARTQVVAFSTWGDFALEQVSTVLECGYPSGKRNKGTMAASPTWTFSNPIDAISFFGALKISPLPPAPSGRADQASEGDHGDESGGYDGEGGYHAGGSSFSGPLVNGQALRLVDHAHRDGYGPQGKVQRKVSLQGLRLALGQTYHFELGPGVKDAFGNALSAGAKAELAVPDYCPTLHVPSGYSVMESYLKPHHPADGLNIKEWPVSLWSFKTSEAVAALESLQHYGASFPGTPAQNLTWTMNAPPNTRSRSYFDLSGALRGRKGGLVGFSLPSVGDGHPIRGVDNLTDLGLTFKTAPDSTLLWVTRLKDGKPAPDTAVELRLVDNRKVWSGRSDEQGLVRAPGWRALGVTRWDGDDEIPRLYAIAYSPNGDAILGNLSPGIEPWRFGMNYAWKPEERHHRGLLFTDRGIYRPGETLKAKAVFRSLDVDDWGWPASKDIELTLLDSRGERMLTRSAKLGARGSLSLSFDLPASAPTGQYQLQARQQRRSLHLSAPFRVEAFKPAAFEVRVKNHRAQAYHGEAVGADVEGWYLYGAPMSGAPAQYSVMFRTTSYNPPGWEGYEFSRGWWEPQRHSGERLGASGTLTLSAKGLASLRALTKGQDIVGPYLARFEVGVTSPDRQRLFGRSSHLVHPSRYYVGAQLGARVLESGQRQPLSIVVCDVDGKPVPGVEIKGRWHRREHLSVRRVGLHGRLTWERSSRDVQLPEFKLKSGVKPVVWSFAPDKPGQYYLALEVKDPDGRSNKSAAMAYVAGPGQSWWGQEDHDLIQLVPDKKDYRPGDEARILVQSPWERARALVTVERETVMDSWVVELKSASSLISVPIKESYLPNAFVSVTLVRGRLGKQDYDEAGLDLSKPQARFGYAALPVLPAGRGLDVTVELDKQDYRPGQTVRARLRAQDAAGGAEATELTVWAVDEGVLQLTGYSTPDLFGAFYGPRPLYVRSADARLHVLGQRSYGEKGEARGGGGGSGGLDAIDLRGDFRFLAHWSATVTTDAQGAAQVDFKLPDNLSAFRLMVAAHTQKRFGKAERRFTVSKPLMLRPSLPRFARVGDAFEGGVVVHNNSTQDAEVLLQALTKGEGPLALGGEARQRLSVPAGKAVEARWPMQAKALGQGVLEFRASADLEQPESDGLRWEIPVSLPEKRETVATAGISEGESLEALVLPKAGVAETGDVEIRFASTALGGLKDGVDYLLDYPYGCLEQQLSRTLPIVSGAELLEALGLQDLTAKKAAAQAVMDALPGFQCHEGGYSYWSSIRGLCGSPYLTAYALEVAWLAKEAGLRVPEPSLQKAQAWLRKVFEERQSWAYPYTQAELFVMRAYALDVLSLYGSSPSGYLDQLYGRRDQLPFLAKAHLLKAARLLKADQGAIDTLAQELLNQGRVSPRSLHFELPEGERMPWVHGSSVKATAVVLEALLRAKGGFSGDEKAVAWLSGERRAKGRWRSTQENAWGLRAFSAFFRRYEKEPPSFDAEVLRTGPGAPRSLWQQPFKGRSLETLVKILPFADVFGQGTEARLAFKRRGQGRLYYSLAMKYVPARFDAHAWEGFELERELVGLDGAPVKGALEAGKRYKVNLTVRSRQDRTFVALVDPLPGGVEAVNTALATESQVEARQAGVASGWGGWVHSEQYDDRVQVFADYLAHGSHRFSYLVQATTPGSYAKPAAWVEQMYEPEVFGRTATGQLEVSPAP